MSRTYSLDTKIDTSFNSDSVSKILKTGETLGFIYREFTINGSDPSLPKLTPMEAMGAVFLNKKENAMACIFLQIEDTYLTLHFLDSEKLIVMFSGLSQIWSKTFEDGDEDIDVARYAKALLDLVSDFKILEMHIEKD